jgi:putative lipoprotein
MRKSSISPRVAVSRSLEVVMSRDSTPRGRTIAALALSVIAFSATAVRAQTIQRTASYRERMALPPGVVLEATLDDVSRADAPATTIASTRVTSPGNPPITFTIGYDPAAIVQTRRYIVRVRIVVDGKLLFTSETATPVITQGNPTTVSLMLRRVGAGQAAGATAPPAQSAAPLSLAGIYWRATELAGKATPGKGGKQEAHLQFQAGGRVTGADGCNRINGTYEVKGTAITFGAFAATQMACPGTEEVQAAFREMLKRTSRYAITGSRLELFDEAGTRVASFDAITQPPVV